MKAGFALSRHLFQFRKGCVNRTGAELAASLDDAIEPAVDIHDRALARSPVAAVALRRGVSQARHVERPAADRPQDRLGDGGLTHPNRVVEVAAHGGDRLAAIIGGKWLK